MSSFFSFNFNVNLIYIIIYWILEIFIRLSMYYEPKYYIISNDPKENEYMFILYPVISKLFSGFIILYVYCVLHRKKRRKYSIKNELIYENPIHRNKNKYYYLKLLFITCLEIVVTSSYFIYFWAIVAKEEEISKKHSKDVLTIMDILTRYIFSIFILKVKIFKHHLWSLYAMIFAFVLIIPFDFLDIYYKENVNFIKTLIYILVLAVQSVLYPLEDTFIKKFFNSYYILPEKLLFSVAILETAILTIISVILYLIDVLKFNLIFSQGIIIAISIYILATAVREYILMKIIYLYSSQSIAFLIISQNISVSLIDIINFIKEKDKRNIGYHVYLSFPFEIIALFVIIIATSVYDEIIIINRWGLNANVKRGIIERALKDAQSTLIERTESFEDYVDSTTTIN